MLFRSADLILYIMLVELLTVLKRIILRKRESSLLCFSPVINFVLILLMQKVHTDCDGLKELLERGNHKPRLIRWILLLQEFELQIMQRQETKVVNAASISILERSNLIERDFSPGDFYLQELLEELRLIPPKESKSLSLEEFFSSN